MLMPPVSQFMTDATLTVGPDQTLTTAHRMMRDHQIRHLPVLRGGQLVGIVSQRDLHLLETLKGVDPDEQVVEEAMTQDVQVVPPDAPLDYVAALMCERKLGSVVVVSAGKVAGIFTTIDALRALVDILLRTTA